MLTQAEFDAMLQRYLEGRSLPGEQHLVEQWSQQLSQAYHQPLPPHLQEEVRAAMWRRIEHQTQASVQLVPTHRPWAGRRAPALRWAATLLLGLGLGTGYWLAQHRSLPLAAAQPHWQQQTNAHLPAQMLQLADGSRVTLYAGSTLRYQAGLPGGRREVYLTGKAFFKVAKNPQRPFLVYTDKLLTSVLGTSFLVTAYANQPASVAVREGKVMVQARQAAQLAATPTQPAAAGLLLLPNQQAVYSATTRHLAKALVDKPLVLAPQSLAFHNRAVPAVLAALEKAYGVTIVYDLAKLKDCTITIAFGDETLAEQLTVLCKAIDAKYVIDADARIIIEGPGCKVIS